MLSASCSLVAGVNSCSGATHTRCRNRGSSSTTLAGRLEFRAVAIVGCDRNQLPLRTVASRLRDAADREAFIEQERHLLYVACTRARERLRVTWSGQRSEWLPTR